MSSPRRAGSFASSPRRGGSFGSSPPAFNRLRSGSGSFKDSARRSGSFASSNSTRSSPNAVGSPASKFAAGALGGKFRAAAKKAIAANRVRDAKVVQPSGKHCNY